MRPKALEAAAVQNDERKSPAERQIHSPQDQATSTISTTPPASIPDSSTTGTDGTTEATPTAATIVSQVVQSVKIVVDGAIAWGEQKVDKLSAEQDTTGPYASPATCMPSDLDAIASGILPAMSAVRQYEGGVDDETKEGKCTEKGTKTRNGEGEKKGSDEGKRKL